MFDNSRYGREIIHSRDFAASCINTQTRISIDKKRLATRVFFCRPKREMAAQCAAISLLD